MARLPQPGGDKGNWGAVLNDFLLQTHNADGTLKPGTITAASLADGSIEAVKLDSAVQASLSAVGGKANDGSVVHLSSDETIGGVKTFSTSPMVPSPTTASQAANKSYVDAQVSAVSGSGGGGAPADGSITTAKLADGSVTTAKVADGGISSIKIANASITQVKLSAGSATNGQVLGSDGTTLVWTTPSSSGSISDASTGAKGVVQLAGDLSGTAAAPTIAAGAITQGKLSAGSATNGQVLGSNGTNLVWTTPSSSGSVADASTSAKGIIQLAGDLSGTAAAPTIAAGVVSSAKLDSAVQSTLSSVAGKAADNTVVHLAGAETISGAKTFSAAVTVATPTANGHAATKSYVDTQIAAGGGSGGGTGTGDSVQKQWEDDAMSMHAIKPSTESGLTAVAADASTNDAPRIQAMLDYLKATYGGGTLILPSAKTLNCNATITIPSGVQLAGGTKTIMDFWFGGSAITALIINDNNFTPLRDVKINGNQYDANTNNANTTTSTGIRVTGATLNFYNVAVNGFNWGIDFTQDNTYIHSFVGCAITSCKVGLNLDLANTFGTGSASNNSGERMVFTNSVIANCDTAFWASGAGVGLHFVSTSIDFVKSFGKINGAHVFFDSSHLESQWVSSSNPGSGGTRNAFMFELANASRLNMVNCNIILGTGGIYYMINPAVGPTNYGSGMAHFKGCNVYNQATPGAGGAYNGFFSEQLIRLAPNVTTYTLYSIFATRWNSSRVALVASDGSAVPDLSVRITGHNITDSTITVELSAPAPSGTTLEFSF